MTATTERQQPAESIHPAVNVSGPETPRRLFHWVEAVTGRALVAETRLPTVRPAWRIDLQGPRDVTTPFVIRCARPAGFGLSAAYSLQREARVLSSLMRHGFPVPRVEAESADPEALLLECMPGTSDFSLLDANPAWKRTVVAHFIELLVRLHAIPVAELDIPGAAPRPDTTDAALDELAIWKGLYLRAAEHPDSLLCFTLEWLERNAPVSPECVLVQGDTGPNQCLFDERGVTGVLDWELAHVGDPMEDLGWIAARTFFASFGSLPELLQRYARLAGRELDFHRIGYYRVMALVKCAIATGLARASLGAGDDIGSILCWDTITRHALAWSLAESTTGTRPDERQLVSMPSLDPVPAAIATALRELAAGQAAPYDALRIRGFADSVAWCALRQSVAHTSRPEALDAVGVSTAGAADAARARQFLAREQLDSTLLAEAFGERGRIRLEALQ